MKKLIGATAVCAVAIGLVAVPAAAVKSPKQVGGTVSVNVTPTTFTTGDATVTSASVSGVVSSNSNCKKDRTVSFQWVDGSGTAVAPAIAATATTKGNGFYSATVDKPAPTPPPTTGTTATVYLKATVAQVTRRVGSKKKGKKTKKGRRFDCLQITGQSGPVTVLPAPTV
jgi:hypothetical protein